MPDLTVVDADAREQLSDNTIMLPGTDAGAILVHVDSAELSIDALKAEITRAATQQACQFHYTTPFTHEQSKTQALIDKLELRMAAADYHTKAPEAV